MNMKMWLKERKKERKSWLMMMRKKKKKKKKKEKKVVEDDDGEASKSGPWVKISIRFGINQPRSLFYIHTFIYQCFHVYVHATTTNRNSCSSSSSSSSRWTTILLGAAMIGKKYHLNLLLLRPWYFYRLQ